MSERVRLAVSASVLLLASLGGCSLYTLSTGVGPARGIPRQFFGIGPGEKDMDAFRRNGWALADSHDGIQMYVRAGSDDIGASEVEAVVVDDHGHPKVDYVRLRFDETRLATYRELVKSLIAKHGPPQYSEERDSFPQFVLDPHSDHALPDKLIVHRWQGGSVDMVLVGGLEQEENLKASMDYQLLLMSPRTATVSAVP